MEMPADNRTHADGVEKPQVPPLWSIPSITAHTPSESRMSHRRFPARLSALALSLVATLATTAVAQPAQTAPVSQAVAFVDVNVVPMDRERVLERQTVIVRDGRIAAIG